MSKVSDSTARVIFHLDLDAFYAQVEQRRLGLSSDIPIAVQQWNGIIAVNYAARALGVSRSLRADEAREKFPSLKLVHVEVLEHEASGQAEHSALGAELAAKRNISKASLRRYREASFQVMNVIRGFVPACFLERASIDEVYIDATSVVAEQLDGKETLDPRELQLAGTQFLGERLQPSDRDLVRGAMLMTKIRAAILQDTTFTISGGVASNKLLAKIASARYKPNKQTLVPRSQAAALVRSLPLTKIPGLGGKLGKMVLVVMQDVCNSTGEASANLTLDDLVKKVPWSTLVQRFGQEGAQNLHNKANGISYSKVCPKMAPKSLLSAKTFKATADKREIRSWLRLLATEQFDRASTDAVMFGRIATKMVLYWSGPNSPHCTRRMAVPNPNPFLAHVLNHPGLQVEPDRATLERLVDLIMDKVPPNQLTFGVSLQLEAFEDCAIPGSWVSNTGKSTKQQETFTNFFKTGEQEPKLEDTSHQEEKALPTFDSRPPSSGPNKEGVQLQEQHRSDQTIKVAERLRNNSDGKAEGSAPRSPQKQLESPVPITALFPTQQSQLAKSEQAAARTGSASAVLDNVSQHGSEHQSHGIIDPIERDLLLALQASKESYKREQMRDQMFSAWEVNCGACDGSTDEPPRKAPRRNVELVEKAATNAFNRLLLGSLSGVKATRKSKSKLKSKLR